MTLRQTAPGEGDPRLEAARRATTPAWLVRGDAVVWCNAAGAAALGWQEPWGKLPARTAAAIAKVAAGLPPAGGARLAMLRIGSAGAFAGTLCRCTRHLGADGSRSVLIEAMAGQGLAAASPAAAEPPREAPAPLPEPSPPEIAPAELPPIEVVEIVEPALLAFPAPAPREEPPAEPVAVAEPEPPPAPAPRRPESPGETDPPLRFVFETDADSRITFLSPEAVTAIGQAAARLFARPWHEAAGELGLDPEGKVEAALGRRDTWSGVTIDWVFADGSRRPVALSALPMFDRDRRFRGYRGFGVCRPEAAAAAAPVPAEAPAPSQAPAEAAEPDDPKVIDFEARTGVRGGREAAERSSSSLTPSERSAFREIARALGTRGALAEDSLAEPAPVEEPAPADQRPLVEELTAILDLAGDPALVVDTGGRIVRFTAAVPGFFGRRSGDLPGLPFTALLAPESHALAEDHLEAARAGAPLPAEGREVLGLRRDGSTVPMLMRIGRGPDGERLAIVLRDLSPWRKAEEELLSAKQRSDRASSQKSDFLAKISHEIRTPLNAIIGFSEVMSEERFGPVGNPRYREYLRDIRASGEHLVSLVNDLLDLSKIEAGKLDLNFTSVDLNDVVQGCVAIMQPQSHARQIVIRTSLSRALPRVVADERSVRQIVLNLLSNAVKFTEPGGQVIVATALTDLGQAVIRVRDTGVGMSARDIETALEPFRQLVTATAGGTGLGLPLTKALVEANKATFAIESEIGEGTLVEVIFPPTRVLGE